MDTKTMILLVYVFQMAAAMIAVFYGHRVMRLTGCTRTFMLLAAFVVVLIIRHALAIAAIDTVIFSRWTFDSTWFIISHYVIALPIMSVLFTGFMMSLYYDLRGFLNGMYRKPPTP